ncbi:MAG: ATP-binding protein [Minisyncoccia bacterium]
MDITALVQTNFDLLSVGIAIASMLFLGTVIFFNNTGSITNRTFLLFSILTAIWGISNYLEYHFTTIEATLWAFRIHVFLSTLHAFVFFQLAYVFPRGKARFPRWYKFFLVPVVGITAILSLTPLIVSGIAALAPQGYVTNPERGPGIALFSVVAFGLLIAGVVTILIKAWRNKKVEERNQEYFFAVGMALTAALILLFNVFLPIFLNQLSFIPLAALFLLPFTALISYAIYRHNLFNLKVAGTAFLGFMVTIFSVVNILYSTQTSEIVINITAFLIVLIGSIKIVQDTLNLAKITEELQNTNERQEALIHFIGHEVKGFLTKDTDALAALSDGDFGALPDALKPIVEHALAESRQGADAVASILKASNLKKGVVSYTMESFDFKTLVEEAVENARSAAEQKGLALTFSADESGVPYTCIGDKEEIRDHVLRNLLENAVNYTPSGSITVSLKKENGKIIFTEADTGIGITEEDKKRLFTEGGHGKDSQRVNVHSTGYGLFAAKSIVEAHRGSIRAESEGAGKGTTFVVEFPA